MSPRTLKYSDLPPSVRRRIRREAAKKGKDLTPEQILRRAKREQQEELARRRAAEFKVMCRDAGLPLPVQEYRFAADSGRKWEADFCWVEERVVLEVEGGAWSGGRHTRGSGYLADMEKYNQMTLRGFRLVRCTPAKLCTEETVNLVKQLVHKSEAA